MEHDDLARNHKGQFVKTPLNVENMKKRFWSKVDKTGGCWLWTSAKNKGYGAFSIKSRARLAHQLAYELVKGEIPPGLELDHLCKNPQCVNPDHLEPVTHQENMARSSTRWDNKTHCINGHEYNVANISINKRGSRWCKVCHREADKAYRERRLVYGTR